MSEEGSGLKARSARAERAIRHCGSRAAVLDERTSRHAFRLRVSEEGSGLKARSSRAERAIRHCASSSNLAASVGNRAPAVLRRNERRCSSLRERRRSRRTPARDARAAQIRCARSSATGPVPHPQVGPLPGTCPGAVPCGLTYSPAWSACHPRSESRRRHVPHRACG